MRIANPPKLFKLYNASYPADRSIVDALNCVTALQAEGYPSIIDRLNYQQLSRLLAPLAILEKSCHSTALLAAGSPGYTRKIMTQLFRLLALQAILRKPCHSSPGCRLSRLR